MSGALVAPPLAEGRFSDVAGALLLGGASRRMGRDKAHLEVAGDTASTLLARLLEGLFEEVLLVGGEPPPGTPGRRVEDPEGPRCALRGLVAALEAPTRASRVLVVATDLVALTPEVPLALLAWPAADVVLPATPDAKLQPLCALYRREAVLPRARQHLAAGRLALHELLEDLEVRTLTGPDLAAVDPEGLALSNVNTPEQLAALLARLAPSSEAQG